MSAQPNRLLQQKQQSPILFASNQFKGNRLSLLSVYFQTASYYDSILTNIFIPLQLLIFVFKYNILYYESNVIVGEIILLVIGFFLNMWRLHLGRTGNKGKRYQNIIGYFVLSIIVIVGFFYIVAIQSNVLWLQFIMFVIVLVVALTQFLLMILLGVYYKANQM